MSYMASSDLKRDGVLVPISSIYWLAKNVFNVVVPFYRRVISCELTAVDVPRGTAKVLEDAMAAAVKMVCDAPCKYLRQDYYTDFPLVGYGDIIFSTDKDLTKWASLQETLLRFGVARIIRPIVVRLQELIEAEREGASATSRCAWAADMRRHEGSEWFRKEAKGRIVDVLRGDAYAVRWDEEYLYNAGERHEANTSVDCRATACKGGYTGLPLPELVILDAVKCYPRSTSEGYKALRWAQKTLLFSRVEVCIHSVSPSEMDVANNTQLFSHDQLRCVRAAVRVVSTGLAQDAGWDVECRLLRDGTGLMRQVVDASMPRASNFHDLLHALRDSCQTVCSASNAGGRCSEGWLLGESPSSDCTVSSLKEFLGSMWFEGPSLVKLWKASMFAGNLFQSPHEHPPRTHVDRPMRSVWNVEVPVLHNMTFRGVLKGLTLVEECSGFSSGDEGSMIVGGLEPGATSGQERSLFLRVEVDATFTDEMIVQTVNREEEAAFGVITFNPPPEAVQGGKVQITIAHDLSASRFSPDDVHSLNVRGRKCKPGEYALKGGVDIEGLDSACPVKGVSQVEMSVCLALGSGEKEMFFVLEVTVFFRDSEKKLERQVIYLLSDTPEMTDNEDVLSISDDDEGNDSLPTNRHAPSPENAIVDEEHGSVEGEKGEQGAGSQRFNEELSASGNFYHSVIDFYFKVGVAGWQVEGLVQQLRRNCEKFAYRDVLCIPVGVGTVNGDQGYVGDILVFGDEGSQSVCGSTGMPVSLLVEMVSGLRPSSGQPPSTPVDEWSKVPTLLAEWCSKMSVNEMRGGCRQQGSLVSEWGKLTSVYDEMADAVCVTGGSMSDKPFSGDDVRSSNPMATPASDVVCASDQENAGEVFRLSAGTRDFWHVAGYGRFADVANPAVSDIGLRAPPFPLLSGAFLPPSLPLFAVSIFPRQLFAAHHKHHRSLVNSSDSLTAKQSANLHVDAAFVRLPRPFLPNLYTSNLERLPVALRDTTRRFVESLMDGRVPKRTDAPETVFYALEGVFSRVLSLFFMLRPYESSPEYARRPHCDVYKLLGSEYKELVNVSEPTVKCNAVLYSVYPKGGSQAGDVRQSISPVLFLGSRCTPTSEAFGDQRSVLSLDESSIRYIVSVLGVESLASSAKLSASSEGCRSAAAGVTVDGAVLPLLEGGSNACYPMASRGIGERPLINCVPRLYLPLPWLAILGRPLFAREESVVGIQGSPSGGEKRTLYVAVSYVPMYCVAKKAYRSFSYGRCKRLTIYRCECKRSKRGMAVKDYFSSLLLRRHLGTAEERLTGGFADGILRVYGTVNEPQFIYYTSREQLRFRLGMQWPSVLGTHNGTGDDAKAELETEESLLRDVAEAVRCAIDMVVKKLSTRRCPGGDGSCVGLPPPRVYLDFRLDFGGKGRSESRLRVKVYPVSEEYDDTRREGGENGCSEERGEGAFHKDQNPYRPFDFCDNVLSRCPSCVLVVSYCDEKKKYNYEWDSDYEAPSQEQVPAP